MEEIVRINYIMECEIQVFYRKTGLSGPPANRCLRPSEEAASRCGKDDLVLED